MAETLKEAIAEAEEKQEADAKIFMVQFSEKVYFNLGPGLKFIERYSAEDRIWRNWKVDVGDRVLVFRCGRREIVVPVGQCIIEWRAACPRCGTFINLKSHSGHCPSPTCTWPKPEINYCPECHSQLGEGAEFCPNKACRWGWKAPEDDVPVTPADTRARVTGTCPDCDSQMRDGKCPLGCGELVEPKPDTLLKKGKEERTQWP